MVIDQVKLELGPFLRQPAPVDVEHVAVVVVLAKRILGQLPRRLGQLGALGDAHSSHLVVMIALIVAAPARDSSKNATNSFHASRAR